MLKALSDYYVYLSKQEKSSLSPKGYSKVNVNYNLILKSNGEIKEIVPYTKSAVKGNKQIEVGIEELFPFRNSIPAIAAETIEHREKYLFGLIWDKKESKLIYDAKSILAFEKNKEKNLAFLDDLSSPIIDAYKNFLNNWNVKEEVNNEKLMQMGKDYEGAKFIITLEYEDDKLNDDIKVKEKWNRIFNSKEIKLDEEMVQCSISGKWVLQSQIPETHNKIKGIIGEDNKPASLVSFNKDSFCSYNKEQSSNSYVSNIIMEQYTEAFNILASDNMHKQMLNDITFLFWAMTDKDETPYLKSLSFLVGFNSEQGANTKEVDENLNSVFTNLAEGKECDWQSLNIDETVEFYILGIKHPKGRFAMKIFEHNSFGKMMKNVAKHQNDLRLSKEDKNMALWQIEEELKSPVANTNISPDLNIKLLESILNNKPYPHYLLSSLIIRAKVDKKDEKKKFEPINRNRVRIIRACLIRLKIIEGDDSRVLNLENKDSAYNCGRLFAVLENIQKSAMGDINSSIKDSFFASACSTPYLVYPKLVKLAQNHLKKLDNAGTKIYYDKLLQQVMANLEDSFPKTLSMEKQGIFILGYYQQKESFYTKKNNEEEGE